ncbi:uncharacterized protein LOC115448102 [Manduca sexta]|uniref:CRAL-TRIO domain-containing protein n=1 Tax=Manduca sexta TaxID=7130 RepID=A0A921ZHW9_MANSE|nr:uncharacterized protein LOC115448102 [Manduca sexta]XP_030031266.1 uncharacterized protein LOC115448102 [Manduca sexta]KAG6457313.1 hypothetical protein O3G_MSEX010231 [Manduca sexta]KAG6457314.1 hypothetical protein O3G_MSEX010231 [Manduca sexta]KAG6457315.1 hypothetical protein O3G_MSEX010231 [Manduca sexta]
MESLPSDPILEYNDDTFESLRKQYNFEKKEDMDAAIDVFEEWLKKQNHFTRKEYPREHLERLIILHKGSVERAKTHMDKLCTLKTLLPHFFEHYDVRNDCASYINDAFIHAMMSKLTPEHYRVYLCKVNINGKFPPNFIMKLYIMTIIYSEYLTSHDYCDGFVILVDLRHSNIMDIIKEINLLELRQIIAIAMEGYGLRIKGIHMLTSSSTIDMLTKIMKQMFSAKIGGRIFVHRTMESLCEVVPKDILPVEYGGTQESLESIYEKWLDVLTTKEFMEYLQVMNQARSREDLRLNDTFKEEYMSIAGTFRTLSVD